MPKRSTISSLLHDLIWSDTSQSICSRAWQRQHDSRFWRAWVWVFGRRHCERSWRRWNGGDNG